ncbi:MAG: gamma-glutamyl-gamma-aminobutyrate hydrolase family protein [Clostridia bacterium]|nr:gamma-glutamyl-gamma-aminobutyrate hydrolase family protein [Clostridia bacterium]
MILAIIERKENVREEKPFNSRYFLTEHYKKIFDNMNIILFPIISEKNIDKICDICDGLIVTGTANNINPKYYNEEPLKGEEYNIDEYIIDEEAINIFAKHQKPILGICGGAQSINVVFGGTLYQSVNNHNIKHLTHKIKIMNNTFLNKVYQKSEIPVNSYHHQAIKDVAKDFKISAISEDGIIEAIEKGNIIGVQWHPEKMIDTKFFEKFIEEYF